MDDSDQRHAKKAKSENGEIRRFNNGPAPGDGSADCATSITRDQVVYFKPLTAEATHDNPFDTWEASPDSLKEIGITELLGQDSRPTFILDLQADESGSNRGMNVVFCNKSLRFFDDLRNVVFGLTDYSSMTSPHDSQAAAEFKEWAMSISSSTASTEGYLPGHTYREMFWTCSTLRNRWRVVSASQVPNRRPAQTTPKSRFTSGSAATSISSSVTMRSGTVAIQDRTSETDLWKQLADSESKFKVLTELNPVGMYYLSPDGNIAYANEMWYEITGHPRGLEGEMSFMNVISESDHDLISKEWEILTTEKGKRVFELRLRNPSRDPATGKARQKWILASCDQEFDEEGALISIMGCITDISAQKHAEEDALERANLSEKLALRTEEAAQHERNFQQMAELAPCGMFTFDPEGTITWANSQWYEITGDSRSFEEHYSMSFLNVVDEQDHKAFRVEWDKLTMDKSEVRLELRLKKPWIRKENEAVQDVKWILFLALPQHDENGNLKKVFGCTTDISYFKWAESVQMRSRLQAEEAKRQQESFIDMTSHEMRNPLSAILQCADGIARALIEFQSIENMTPPLKELVEGNLDAAQIIVLCAQHQKRIIDDVLTLSKLNSTMLHVTPVQVQVERTVRRTLKMFEGELQAHDIQMVFEVEPSYHTAKIDWVFCDPVRLTQIFINLLTNAIKFTLSEDHREIAVSLGASISKPPKGSGPDVTWFPSKDSQSMQDLTLAPEWGDGEQVYLYFSVRDTGRGLSDDEKTHLFNRFSQASPRTHVQYGGSGLGLFISRELTELQGGEIGVASVSGRGSTFAFYIKARRSTSSESPIGIGEELNTQTPRSKKIDLSTVHTRIRYNYHILLVEDNLINQKVLSKQLRDIGCTVHVANHGVEALEILAKTTIWYERQGEDQAIELCLILMDLEMPIMDGLTCTRRIRELEREGRVTQHVPIIAVTANTRVEQMDLAIDAGMDDIVPKPFQIPELMQKMDLLMAKKSSCL